MLLQCSLLQDILLGSICLHIYQYLHPKDLSSLLATCNHELWNDIVVRHKIATICMSHLPLQIGIGTNYIADFVEGISFHSQEDLLDFILDKTEVANLLFDGTTTIEESRSRAREMLLPTIRCQHARFYTPNDMFSTTIECHYQWGIEKSSALSWVKYILNRDACKKNVRDRETNQLIGDWLKFLFALLHSSRTNNNLVTFGMWRWSCKNPNLYGHGIAGVGVMIDIQQQQQQQQQSSGHDNSTTSHTFEVRLTRNY